MSPETGLDTLEQEPPGFDSLMPFKIRNILLVSSLYDMYTLREDGHLASMFLSEYAGARLSSAPTIRRVDSGPAALEALQGSDFDLVIVFRSLRGIDPCTFNRRAKALQPDLPVVLLAFHHRELESVRDLAGTAFDDLFIWSGESKILLTILRYVEDRLNVGPDTELVGVRVIILVENSVRFYSSLLPLIYREIMRQAAALLSDSSNPANRLLRMRARPKILLARNFEEALELFKRHKKFLLGVISDIQFPQGGHIDDMAGIHFARLIKKELSDLPVLLQSSNESREEQATACGAAFLNKSSPRLLNQLGTFISRNFGFGDFVFRLPDGSELARASNFRQFQECVARVDIESLLFHAERNHFSNWLMARTEFELASRLRPKRVSEFDDPKDVRTYLLETLKDFRHERQAGVVIDFSREHFDGTAEFLRIGSGSLGGKGRGLAFVNSLVHRQAVLTAFPGARISVPRSAVICTGAFDEFMEENQLTDFALGEHSDDEVVAAFSQATIPAELREDLAAYLAVARYPLAVRSSSLLEDCHFQPFAGIFDTHFLPNNHPSLEDRLERLLAAIKLIYASVYFRNAKNYTESTGNRTEEEKMAVILQEIAGRNRNGRYYPVLSGVARSYNFYSVGRIKPEEGIAYVALGLGKTILEGENCLFFSPASPQLLPQLSTPRDYLQNTQRQFFAVDMESPSAFPEKGGEVGLVRLDVNEAEQHGVLQYVGSTYSADNDRIYPGIARKGTRVVTFDPILKSKIFPLDDILGYLLRLGSSAMNVPIEMEFAVEINPDPDEPDGFHFLQIRPMTVETPSEDISGYEEQDEEVFCKSDQALGHGRIEGIRDIVFASSDNFERASMARMADQVGDYNRKFRELKQPYMLIGPGRWGTADPWLGIPTKWNQISAARVIVEADYGDFVVEPSFGTHFFQNLITFGIGYLTINRSSRYNFFDWDWLNSLEPASETEHLRHVRLEQPLNILFDGRRGKAVAFKPG